MTVMRDGFIVCDFTHERYGACTVKIPNHRWGKIKSVDWFFAKDGKAYCPDHTPDWVAKWREKKSL